MEGETRQAEERHVRVTLQWDDRDLASEVVAAESLDMERWTQSTINLPLDLATPKGLVLPVLQQTVLAVRLEAVDARGRRLYGP